MFTIAANCPLLEVWPPPLPPLLPLPALTPRPRGRRLPRHAAARLPARDWRRTPHIPHTPFLLAPPPPTPPTLPPHSPLLRVIQELSISEEGLEAPVVDDDCILCLAQASLAARACFGCPHAAWARAAGDEPQAFPALQPDVRRSAGSPSPSVHLRAHLPPPLSNQPAAGLPAAAPPGPAALRRGDRRGGPRRGGAMQAAAGAWGLVGCPRILRCWRRPPKGRAGWAPPLARAGLQTPALAVGAHTLGRLHAQYFTHIGIPLTSWVPGAGTGAHGGGGRWRAARRARPACATHAAHRKLRRVAPPPGRPAGRAVARQASPAS